MKLVKESLNFERGLDPRDAMQIGLIKERKMKAAYKKMKKVCHQMLMTIENKDKYLNIKEDIQKDYIKIGIEHTNYKIINFYYLVYIPDEDIGDIWAAGYTSNYNGERLILLTQDKIDYDNLEDAVNKMKWWLISIV